MINLGLHKTHSLNDRRVLSCDISTQANISLKCVQSIYLFARIFFF